MYPPHAPDALAKLMRAGLLGMDGAEVKRHGLDNVNDAIAYAAAKARPFQRTELWMKGMP